MYTSLRRAVLAFAAVMLCAAAAPPDFSGKWKLDPAKSKLSGDYAGLEEDRTVDHKDPALKIAIHSMQDGDENKTTVSYKCDGKENRNLVDGYTMTSVVTWSGDSLVMESILIEDTDTVETTDRWTLSPDGRQLTIVRKQKVGSDQQESTFVYNRL